MLNPNGSRDRSERDTEVAGQLEDGRTVYHGRGENLGTRILGIL